MEEISNIIIENEFPDLNSFINKDIIYLFFRAISYKLQSLTVSERKCMINGFSKVQLKTFLLDFIHNAPPSEYDTNNLKRLCITNREEYIDTLKKFYKQETISINNKYDKEYEDLMMLYDKGLMRFI